MRYVQDFFFAMKVSYLLNVSRLVIGRQCWSQFERCSFKGFLHKWHLKSLIMAAFCITLFKYKQGEVDCMRQWGRSLQEQKKTSTDWDFKELQVTGQTQTVNCSEE